MNVYDGFKSAISPWENCKVLVILNKLVSTLLISTKKKLFLTEADLTFIDTECLFDYFYLLVVKVFILIEIKTCVLDRVLQRNRIHRQYRYREEICYENWLVFYVLRCAIWKLQNQESFGYNSVWVWELRILEATLLCLAQSPKVWELGIHCVRVGEDSCGRWRKENKFALQVFFVYSPTTLDVIHSLGESDILYSVC